MRTEALQILVATGKSEDTEAWAKKIYRLAWDSAVYGAVDL